METPQVPVDGPVARTQTRGISYPSMSLGPAIEQARKFYAAERKQAAPVLSAIEHFGYSTTSSGGRSSISALLQFGLLEDFGRKDERQVKLTDQALDVLLADAGSPEQIRALRSCVSSPKIYAEIFKKWPDELPSNSTIQYFLLREKNFNPAAVSDFLRDLRASLILAEAENPRDLTGTDELIADLAAQSMPVARAPLIEGTEFSHRGTPALSAASIVQAVAVEQGYKEWMLGSLSKSTSYKLFVNGEIGAREISRLLKMLEVQREILADADEDNEL